MFLERNHCSNHKLFDELTRHFSKTLFSIEKL